MLKATLLRTSICALLISAFSSASIAAVPEILTAGNTNLSASLQVPTSCAVPTDVPNHHTYYVDPENGNMSNDGSQQHPWSSLSAIMTSGMVSTMPSYWDAVHQKTIKAMPNAPVIPGDVIYLMSGNYGNVIIWGDYTQPALGFDNPEFITIQAAPNQTPVLGNLVLGGGGKWAFRGLTIENTLPNLDKRAYSFLAMFEERHHDIIFDNNILISAADTSSWTTQADWLANASSGVRDYGAGYNGANCVTISNNIIKNVGFGIQSQRSNNVLILHNFTNYFLHDGLDYGSNNMLIQYNVETNHITAGDELAIHPDFMQGQPWGSFTVNVDHLSNIVIDSNLLIRQTDPNMPFTEFGKGVYGSNFIPGAIQGIDTFNGVWANITVTNNVIITTTYQGIAYNGVTNLLVENNTLMTDGYNVGSPKVIPWITMGTTTEDGAPSYTTNAVIRNNITPTLIAHSDAASNYVVDHNLCVPSVSDGTCIVVTENEGKLAYNNKSGTYGDHNVVGKTPASKLFATYDPANYNFDLHLVAGTEALDMGSSVYMPPLDLMQVQRSVPPDAGALVFVPAVAATPFVGTLTIEANARQLSNTAPPLLIVSVDGQVLSTTPISATVHTGATETYQIPLNLPSHPMKITLQLMGYGDTVEKYVSLNVFHANFNKAGSRVVTNLVKNATPLLQTGTIQLLSDGAAFETNGSSLTYDVSSD